MINKALLQWQLDAGVDEAIGEEPVDRLARGMGQEARVTLDSPSPLPLASGPMPNAALAANPLAAAHASRALADKCNMLEELKNAIENFDGLSIKKTASKTVFGDGQWNARIMVIGEAPGAEEDKQGIPFCGPSGKLLDKTLKSIGLERSKNIFISNTVYWRPPGNRQPSKEETAICLPFVEKMIALINPALLILSGGTATTTLLNQDVSISRLRGKFYDYTNPYLQKPIPVAVTYHPSYLMRSPGQKKQAWLDMQMIRKFLKDNNISY